VQLRGLAARAELELLADGAEWRAVEGELLIDGRRLAAGECRRVPWSRPVQLAGTPLAVSGADMGDAAPTAPSAPAARPRWGRRLVTGGAALVAASLSMLALAMAIAPQPPTAEQQARRAEALLRSAGLTAISASVSEGRLVIDGYLETDAERTRAEQVLAAQGLRPELRVWVNETVVRAVQDVYRVQGVAAQVQATGPGSVRVSTALADPSPLPEIEAAARRDVRGLNRLDARNQPPAHVPSPIPALDDPGKRVAGIVAGPEPYVVTADGTRYFVGALLPTGHRIVAIAGSRVELEREGQASAVVF
jgi:type III secretion protein D